MRTKSTASTATAIYAIARAAALLMFAACMDSTAPPLPASQLQASAIDANLANVWRPVASLAAPRTSGAAALFKGGCVWYMGGLDQQLAPVSTVEIACNTTPPPAQWTAGPALPQPLFEPAGAAVIGNAIYLVGGLGASYKKLSTMYVYTTGTGWQLDAEPLPVPLACGAASVWNGKLYVFGVTDFPNFPENCEISYSPILMVYDPSLSSAPRWRMLATPPYPHAHGGMGVVGARLYLLGGSVNGGVIVPGTVDVFDLTTEAWLPPAALPPRMPTPRTGVAVGVAQGRIFAVGGDNGNIPYVPARVVEAYDPATNGWAQLRSLTDYRFAPSVVATNGNLVAIGGEVASVEWLTLGTGAGACDVFEPDGAPAKANPWDNIEHVNDRFLVGAKVTEGRICSASDVDYISFVDHGQDRRRTFTFKLTPPPGRDYQLELLNATGSDVLAFSRQRGAVPETILFTGGLPATYLLRIRTQDGSFDPANRYTLELTP